MKDTASKPVIVASDHLAEDGSVVASAGRLAAAILQALQHHATVKVELSGIRGATTSYFNMLLRELRSGLGAAPFDQRIEFAFASRLQSDLFDRSRRAVDSDPVP